MSKRHTKTGIHQQSGVIIVVRMNKNKESFSFLNLKSEPITDFHQLLEHKSGVCLKVLNKSQFQFIYKCLFIYLFLIKNWSWII